MAVSPEQRSNDAVRLQINLYLDTNNNKPIISMLCESLADIGPGHWMTIGATLQSAAHRAERGDKNFIDEDMLNHFAGPDTEVKFQALSVSPVPKGMESHWVPLELFEDGRLPE